MQVRDWCQLSPRSVLATAGFVLSYIRAYQVWIRTLTAPSGLNRDFFPPDPWVLDKKMNLEKLKRKVCYVGVSRGKGSKGLILGMAVILATLIRRNNETLETESIQSMWRKEEKLRYKYIYIYV